MREERGTDKESLLKILQSNYQRSSSLEEFYSKLHEVEIETYLRSGKITGVVFNGRKFRFSRLGIGDDTTPSRERIEKREKQLQKVRSKSTRVKERNR